jgi:hypothetical protein
MKFAEGKEFIRVKPEVVIRHLESVKRERIAVNPMNLRLVTGKGSDSEKVILIVSKGYSKYYEVRKSFLIKLLRWYNFPVHIMDRLSTETVLSAANDFLLNIKSNTVHVKLENEEALTITGSSYTDLTDLDVLYLCNESGAENVSRNDFFLNLNSRKKYNFEPVPGDDCGFGFNIFNSETGYSSLKVSHFILRYICSNGATRAVKNGERIRLSHRNLRRSDALDYINKSVEEIEASKAELELKLCNLTMLDSDIIMETVNNKLTGVIGKKETENLTEEFRLNTERGLKDFDGTQYSLFNFITAKAKDYDIYKRTLLEDLAGNIFLS